MPLLTYEPINLPFNKFGTSGCQELVKLLNQPIGGMGRSEFLRLLEKELHPGNSSVRWNPRRGMIETPGGRAPGAGESARGLKTPMGTAVACNIIASVFASITIQSQNDWTEDLDRAAQHEFDLMILALIKTCQKMQPQASRADGIKLKRTRTRRTANIHAYSRAL